MIKDLYKDYVINFMALLNFGFKKVGEDYFYHEDILNKQFTLKVNIKSFGEVNYIVIDNSFNEEYFLPKIEDIQGEFVNGVRNEIEKVLLNIREKCFIKETFSNLQTKTIINYIKNKYNDELEFLWEKFSNNAIVRRNDNKKWYILFVKLQKNKLGLNGDDIVEVIDLRYNKKIHDNFIDNVRFFPGYHMNKNSWFTIILNNSVKNDEIFKLIDDSYMLAKNKK